MATRTEILLIDDVDGGAASETVEFGIDGVEYEIDLNDEHADAFRNAIAAWVTAARRLGHVGHVGRRSSHGPYRPAAAGRRKEPQEGALGREERDHLRAWAANNGYDVAPRGRIAAEVQMAWIAAGRLMA